MKMVDISIYLFLVLACIGFFNGVTIFGATGSVPITSDYGGISANDSVVSGLNSTTSDTYSQLYWWGSFQWVINGASALWGICVVILDVGGYLHSIFPLIPWGLCNILSALADIVMIIGMYEFVTGRSIMGAK